MDNRVQEKVQMEALQVALRMVQMGDMRDLRTIMQEQEKVLLATGKTAI